MTSSQPTQTPQPESPAPAPHLPFVSVVLPVRNEAAYIAGCIQALAAQDYPRDRFEVLLVDGDSTDGTLEQASAAARACGLSVRTLSNPRRTTAAGVNFGISEARGEVVIKVDGHTRVSPGFISASIRVLQQTGADCAGGAIETVGRSVAGRAIALAMSSPFGVGDAAFRHISPEAQETDSVPFGAYRREVFDRIGLFAEDIDRGEDDEFNYRLRDAGGRIVLAPEIRTTYYCRDSFGELARQYWNYGLAKASVLQRHPNRLRPRHLVPSALVLTIAGGLLLSPFSRRFTWLSALATLAYAGANLVASRRLSSRDPEAAPYLPAAFACIHFCAGAGLIAGFLRRLKRR